VEGMSTAERVRVTLFIACVFGVFVKALWLAIRRLLVGGPTSPGQRRFERGLYAVSAFGVGCVLYGWLVEPYWLAVAHVRVAIDKLPAGAAPVRILHFSDLHCDAKVRLEDTLPGAAAAEKPDLITFSGDAVNGPEGLAHFRRTMERLTKIAPVYASYGNWDTWINAGLNYYGGLPVHHLSAAGEVVTIRGIPLWITGTDAGREGHLQELAKQRPPGAVSVHIDHFPDFIEDAAPLGYDLYLCGHTHGGQIALPGFGALVTFSRFGKRYERGLYRVGSMWAYVNPGVGMEGGPAPRVRFWVRPELTVLELVH
jgi:predicted MPP superfamily phosphohydrolase